MFRSDQAGALHILTCPIQLEAADAEAFRNQSKAWGLLQADVHVLDLKSTRKISKEFYQTLIQFKSALRSGQKALYAINVDKSLLSQFKNDGVEQVFSPVESLEEVKKRSGLVKKHGQRSTLISSIHSLRPQRRPWKFKPILH